jgi:hypothetical protein
MLVAAPAALALTRELVVEAYGLHLALGTTHALFHSDHDPDHDPDPDPDHDPDPDRDPDPDPDRDRDR